MLDEIIMLPCGKAATFPAPSHPMLVVPKLADYAGPNGVVMMATFYVGGEAITRVMVDGHRLFWQGPAKPLFSADLLGISRFPEETNGVPPLRAAHVTSIKVPAKPLRTLINIIEERS